MLCKCGCNKILGAHNKQGYYNIGHYGRSAESRKARSLRAQGDRNPFFGKHHSKKTKLLISQSNLGKSAWNKGIPCREEVKKKLSDLQIGRKRWPNGRKFGPEFGRKIAAAIAGKPKSEKWKKARKETFRKKGHPWLGRQHSEKTRKKMSLSKVNLIIAGKFNPYNQNSGHFYSKKNNKNLFYRSLNERTAFAILENNNNIVKYDVEPFRIEYTFENKTKNYVPDILVYYVDGSKELIEVKPKQHTEIPINIAKRLAAIEYCNKNSITFSTWTEDQLKSTTTQATL